MKYVLQILILEDSTNDAELMQRAILKGNLHCRFHIVMDRNSFLTALEENTYDVVLSDNSLPQFDATEALKIIRERFSHLPFIMVTGTVSEEFAAGIIMKGADDYILKDRMARLPSAINTAIKKRKALKEINDYRYAIDQSAIVYITDKNGIIIYVNKNFCKISKYTSGELLGCDCVIINAGFHPASFIKNLWQTIQSGKTWRGEMYNKSKDGTFYWADTNIIPFLDEKKEPYQYIAISTDITKKKNDEASLIKTYAEKRMLAARMDAILNTIPAHIALIDENGKIIEVNDAWKKFAGENNYSGINYGIGDNYIQISNGPSKNDTSEGNLVGIGITNVLKNKNKEFVYEYPCHSPNTRRWFRMVVTPLHNKENGGAVIMHIDISEIRRLEEERMKNKMDEQNKITEAVINTQEKERNFIAQELHDNVNQILAGTNLILSIAKNYPDQSKEHIQSAMNNIMDAIEENRKIAHTLVSPDFENIHLAEQISSLADNMLKQSGINVYFKAEQLDEKTIDDKIKLALYRIAQEQCTNIIKYAKATLVNIILETNDGIFKMLIADNGNGMEKDKKKTGIGMKNIRARISIYNGEASIKSAPGEGFLLEVKIPLIKQKEIPNTVETNGHV